MAVRGHRAGRSAPAPAVGATTAGERHQAPWPRVIGAIARGHAARELVAARSTEISPGLYRVVRGGTDSDLTRTRRSVRDHRETRRGNAGQAVAARPTIPGRAARHMAEAAQARLVALRDRVHRSVSAELFPRRRVGLADQAQHERYRSGRCPPLGPRSAPPSRRHDELPNSPISTHCRHCGNLTHPARRSASGVRRMSCPACSDGTSQPR
jgi:hypothetical protein